MNKLESIREVYRLYLENKEDEERKSSAFAKLEKLLMSQGKDSKLQAFNEAVGEFTEEMARENPSSGEAKEVVDFILSAPSVYKSNLIPEIILVAVLGHAVKLIPFMSGQDAAELCEKHFSKIGKHFDYPNQKLIYKALKAAMK